jgi:hypothetical protein
MKRVLFLLVALIAFNFNEALAQGCVTCTQTAANLGETAAHGLNTGILYLAAIPLIFLAVITIIWVKGKGSNKVTDQ